MTWLTNARNYSISRSTLYASLQKDDGNWSYQSIELNPIIGFENDKLVWGGSRFREYMKNAKMSDYTLNNEGIFGIYRSRWYYINLNERIENQNGKFVFIDKNKIMFKSKNDFLKDSNWRNNYYIGESMKIKVSAWYVSKVKKDNVSLYDISHGVDPYETKWNWVIFKPSNNGILRGIKQQETQFTLEIIRPPHSKYKSRYIVKLDNQFLNRKGNWIRDYDDGIENISRWYVERVMDDFEIRYIIKLDNVATDKYLRLDNDLDMNVAGRGDILLFEIS